MKTLNYLFAALFAVGMLASCSEKPVNNPGLEGDDNIVISLSGLNTKAIDAVDNIASTTTHDIKNIAIFITNSSDKIIRKTEVEYSADTDSDWAKLVGASAPGLQINNIGAGATKVSVYGNYKTTSKTYVTGEVGGDIAISTTFADQQGTAVLYSGSSNDFSSVSIVDEADGTQIKTYTVSVNIKPVIARMQIKTVTFEATGSETVTVNGDDATVAWTGFTGDLLGVYFNNFYNTYTGTASDVLYNKYFSDAEVANRLSSGKWLFGDAPGTDMAASASYNKWDGSDYVAYDLTTFNAATGKSFAFNFFPGETPRVHFNIANLATTTLTSTDWAVYNPSLLPQANYVNVITYTEGGNAFTFEAGHIYNFGINIKPYFTHSDINQLIYNVIVTVTVEPWQEHNIDPGFQQQ